MNQARTPDAPAEQTARVAYSTTENDGLHQLNAVGNTPFSIRIDPIDPGLVLADFIRADYQRRDTFVEEGLTSFDLQVFYVMLFDLRFFERVAGGVRLFVTADFDQIAKAALASKSGIKKSVRRLLNSGFITATWISGRDRYFEVANRAPQVRSKKQPLQDNNLTGYYRSSRTHGSQSTGYQESCGPMIASQLATTGPLVGNVRDSAPAHTIAVNANANANACDAAKNGERGDRPIGAGEGPESRDAKYELLKSQGLDDCGIFKLLELPHCTLQRIRDVIGRADQQEAKARDGKKKPFSSSRQAYVFHGIEKKILPPLREHEKRAAIEQQQRLDHAAALRAEQRRADAADARQAKQAVAEACRQAPTPLERISIAKQTPSELPKLMLGQIAGQELGRIDRERHEQMKPRIDRAIAAMTDQEIAELRSEALRIAPDIDSVRNAILHNAPADSSLCRSVVEDRIRRGELRGGELP
jgi:hypothetical protein